MRNPIPYEKLSKKERRRADARGRRGWGALNPVTRRPQSPKAYDRRKARNRSDDAAAVPFVLRKAARARRGAVARRAAA